VEYEGGELRAKGLDINGAIEAECVLVTAGKETVLKAEPEQSTITMRDLCYIRLKYSDKKGTVKPLLRGDIKISVKGGELLGFGSACPFYTKNYLGDTADTYYGEALAIVKPVNPGTISVSANSPYGSCKTEIKVVN
jgi:beta-galactosidase